MPRFRSPIGRRAALRLAAAAASVLLGCSSDPLTPAVQAPLDGLPSALVLSPRAITLAVGGTQQIAPTAYSAASTPLTAFDTITYTSSDTTRVRVTPAGLVTAIATTSSAVRIVSAARLSGVTIRDTAYVVVTATATPISAMTLQPQGTDSARYAALSTRAIRGTFTTSGGTTQTPFVMLSVTDASKVRVTPSSQSISGLRPGAVWIYGNATVYGTAYRDSLLMTFTDPVSLSLFVSRIGTAPPTIAGANAESYLVLNGTLTFSNGVADSAGLTFSDPTAFSGGDIPTLGGFSAATRKAIKAGRYTWTASTVPAISGVVVVR